MALIKCSECGKEVSSKAKACPHCGNPIEEEYIVEIEEKKEKTQDFIECSNCGYKNNEGSRFCEKCGISLDIIFRNSSKSDNKELEEYNECPVCGNKNAIDSMFCEKCGNSLKNEKYEEPVEEKVEKEDTEIIEETEKKEEKGNKIECPNCGYENDEEYSFCEKCGASLKEEKIEEPVEETVEIEEFKKTAEGKETLDRKEENKIECPSCGYKNNEEYSFCEKCGTPLKEEKIEEPADETVEIEETEKTEEKEEGKKEYKEDKIECPNCGYKNNQEYAFCEKCGTSLKDEKVELEESETKEKTEKVEKQEESEDKEIKENKKDKIECPNCGYKNNQEYAFCEKCGASLKEEKVESQKNEKVEERKKEETGTITCKKCGTENKKGTLYCKHCGEILVKKVDDDIEYKKYETKDDNTYKVSSNYSKSFEKEKVKFRFANPFLTIFFLASIILGTILFASEKFMDKVLNYIDIFLFNNIFIGCVMFTIGIIVLLHMFIKDGFSIKNDLKHLGKFTLSKFHVAILFIISGFIIVLSLGPNFELDTNIMLGLLFGLSLLMSFTIAIFLNWSKLGWIYETFTLLLSIFFIVLSFASFLEGKRLNDDWKSQLSSYIETGRTNPGDDYYILGFILAIVGLILLISFILMVVGSIKNRKKEKD